MSKNHDDLGSRMKEYYEQVSKTKLLRRTPVAIRIDGKAFHTFTKGFAKPFDDIMIRSMQETTKYLCENIQGCVLGYTQSDEITLILCDYQTLATSAWYDYEVQKLCSVSASMATMAFNRVFARHVAEFCDDIVETWNTETPEYWELEKRARAYDKAMVTGAMFDARCFNIPRGEVTNLVLWRQIDAAKNSVQMLGRAHFHHKELHGLHGGEIQDKLANEAGINWNDLPTTCKRGSCVVRDCDGKWFVDDEIPMFKGDGREYIESLIVFEED